MKYAFIGNRMAVLNEMILRGLHPTIIPIGKTKKQTIQWINCATFDILVSNGCPYVLPLNKIFTIYQRGINIHPSLLPDLRGNSPILGAIKYKRPMGATVHEMEEKVDTGKIIAQVRFEPKDRKDLNECYNLSYKAERDVFLKALKRHFRPLKKQPTCKNPIYYSKEKK